MSQTETKTPTQAPFNAPTPEVLDTRARILRAASRIFVQKGFDGASLRTITQAADVNLAAVNYHFGSKDKLVWEVLRERIEPLNLQRLGLLDEAVARADGGPVPVEEIVDAFMAPVAESMREQMEDDEPILIALVTRMYTESSDFFQELFKTFFKELSERFIAELCRSMPDYPPEEVRQRYMMMVAIMLGVIMHHAKCAEVNNSGFPKEPVKTIMQRMRMFILSGLSQPLQVETS
ncbi:MAG: TetR/AcrR family transcriptional regulator [Opitutales bacterium]